jgi:hypothetical protein
VAQGEVRYRIVADASDFEKGIASARREFEAFGKAVASGVGLGAGFAVGEKAAEALIGSVKAVASAVVDSIASFAKMGSELSDMSAKTGLSTKALQEFGFAARLTGTSTEAMGKAVNQMQKHIIAGDAAFGALGLSVGKLKSMDPEKAFQQVGDAIKNLRTPTEQAAAAMAVFGKAGADILPAIKQGLAESAAEAEKLGLVLSEHAVAAADALDDEVTKLNMAWQGLSNQFAAAAVEGGGITRVVEGLKDGVSDLTHWVVEHKVEISAFFEAISDGATFALAGVRGLAKLLETAFEKALSLARLLAKLPGGGAIGDAVAFVDAKLAGARAGSGVSVTSGPVGTKAQVAAWRADEKRRATAGFDPEAYKKKDEARKKDHEAQKKAAKEMELVWQTDFWEANLKSSELYGKLMLENMEKALNPPMSSTMQEMIAGTNVNGPMGGYVDSSWRGLGGVGGDDMNRAVSRQKDLGVPGNDYWSQKKSRDAAAAARKGAGMDRFLGGASDVIGVAQNLGVGGETLGSVGYNLAGAQRNRAAIKAAGGFGNLSTGAKVAMVGQGVEGAVDIAKHSPGGAKGALGGAAKGAAMGAAFGPWGMAIGAVAGAIIGFFSGPKWAAAAKVGSKIFGFTVSDELGKAILASSKKFGVSLKAASLMNLDKAIAEGVKSGKDAGSFAPQTLDLIKGIADKSIPAVEGVKALGGAFEQIKDSAMKAGTIGDKAMVSIIQAARAAKIKVPEIAAYVKEQLGKSAAAMGGITGTLDGGKVKGGINIATPESAAAQALIFSSTFWAIVAEQGLMAGVDAMSKPFEALMAKLESGGFDVGALLGPMAAMFALLGEGGNEAVRGALEGADALKTALEGVANAGYLTIDVFSAYEHAASDAFDQAVAGGLDSASAYQAIGPLLASLMEASRNTGIALDATTQGLIDNARAAGVAFPVDPIDRMVEGIDRMASAVDRLVVQLGGVVPTLDGIGRAAGNIPPIPVDTYHGGSGYFPGGPPPTSTPTHIEGDTYHSAGGYGRVLVFPKRVARATQFNVHPNEGVAVIPASMMDNRSSAGGYGYAQGRGAAPDSDISGSIASMADTIAGAVSRAVASQAPVQNITIAPEINAMADTMSTQEGRTQAMEDIREQMTAEVRRGMSSLIDALEQQGFRRGA